MLNRLTVSALLKAVILATSICVVIGISLNAWDSWGRSQVTGRIAGIADTSANLFKAMHNLRTDRSTTNRLLNSDQPMDADIEKYLRNLRDTEMPAMGNALGQLASIEFDQQKTLVPELDRLFKTLTAEQKEFWDEVRKPKASRRAALAKEYMETTQGLLETLDKLSAALAADVNHQDATIDQLLAIKQIAWLLRNTAGEASLLISNGLAAGRVSPETRLTYTKFLGGTDIAWSALQLTASGMQLPPALSAAIAATKTAYFDPEYLALRERLLTTLIAGEKAELTANQWSPITVGRLGAAVTVAETALDAAKDHTVDAAFGGSALAGHAARAADRGPRPDVRRHDGGHPPRHQAAAQHARRHAEGGLRRSGRRYRLRGAPGRDRRAGRRARNLQAAGRGQAPDRGAGARTQRRRRRAPAGDRDLCRRIREHGAAGRCSN